MPPPPNPTPYKAHPVYGMNGKFDRNDLDRIVRDPVTQKMYRFVYDDKGFQKGIFRVNDATAPLPWAETEEEKRLFAGQKYLGFDPVNNLKLYDFNPPSEERVDEANNPLFHASSSNIAGTSHLPRKPSPADASPYGNLPTLKIPVPAGVSGNGPSLGRFASRPNPFRDAPEPVTMPEADTNIVLSPSSPLRNFAPIPRLTPPLPLATAPGVSLLVRGPAAPLDPLAGNSRLEDARISPTTVSPATANDQGARFTREGADSTLPLEPDLGRDLTPPPGGKPILVGADTDRIKQWFLGTDKNGSKVYTSNDPRNIVYGDKPVAPEKQTSGEERLAQFVQRVAQNGKRLSPAEMQDYQSLIAAYAKEHPSIDEADIPADEPSAPKGFDFDKYLHSIVNAALPNYGKPIAPQQRLYTTDGVNLYTADGNKAEERPAFASDPALAAFGAASAPIARSILNVTQGATASAMQRGHMDPAKDADAGWNALLTNTGAERIGEQVPELAPGTFGGELYNGVGTLMTDPSNLLFAPRNLVMRPPSLLGELKAARGAVKAAQSMGRIAEASEVSNAARVARANARIAEEAALASAKPSLASSVASSVRNAGAKAAGKISARLAPNAYRRAQTVYATDTNRLARRNGYNYTNPFRDAEANPVAQRGELNRLYFNSKPKVTPEGSNIPIPASLDLPKSATIEEILANRWIPNEKGIIINQRSVDLRQLWDLTMMEGPTGDPYRIEFALIRELRDGQQRFVLYSGSAYGVRTNKGWPIAHTHPPDWITGVIDPIPSRADYKSWEEAADNTFGTVDNVRRITRIIAGPTTDDIWVFHPKVAPTEAEYSRRWFKWKKR